MTYYGCCSSIIGSSIYNDIDGGEGGEKRVPHSSRVVSFFGGASNSNSRKSIARQIKNVPLLATGNNTLSYYSTIR